jgi:hypothetical protein
MQNLISQTISYISFLWRKVQVKQFLAVVLVGVMTLTTNIALGQNHQVLQERVREDIQQNDAQRPKTMREWNREARATEDKPVERLEKIGKESAEAFKEFGSGYVEGAKKTARDVQQGAAEIPK